MRNKLAASGARVVLIAVAVFLMFPSISNQLDRKAQAESQTRQSRKLSITQVKKLPEKSKRFALVIGVDEYQDTQISRLSGASNDAKALADALSRYAGFPQDQVILLASDQPLERQPTRGNILQYLSNLKGVVSADGLLLVSFAGHGIERGGRGYLCPSDARIGGSLSLLESTAVPVDLVHDWIRDTAVKQVLIILDACRNNPGGRGEEQNKLTDTFARKFNFALRNREVEAFATLYATDVGNVAYEYKEKGHGYFTWALVEGLKGAAANEKGEVTLAGLVKYLQEQVPKRVRLDLGERKTQRPYAKTEGYKADELVISVTATLAAPGKLATSVDPMAIELEFWNSIKTTSDAGDLKEYLAKYPNGAFVVLARNKLRAFEAALKNDSAAPSAEPKTAPGEPRPVAGGTATRALGGLPLRGYEFDTVTVNSGGAITNRGKGRAQYCTEDINGVGIELVAMPGDTFTMGSPSGELGRSIYEGPQHQVTVQPFYIGKYEVTQAQWRAVISLAKVSRDLSPDPSNFKGDNLPVEQVLWDDAVEFCARLSRATGRTYRLPTEAEWEYACRGRSTTPFAFGETITPELVNCNGNYPYASAPKGIYRERTAPVGSTGVPNAFGLSDMHGNVWEWCADPWHESYNGAPTDGSSWETAGDPRYRLLRGGSWYYDGAYCRSASRRWDIPNYRASGVGFRVVAVVGTR